MTIEETLKRIKSEINSTKFNEWEKSLSIEEQVVFILHYFKGYSITKISFELNYSYSTIKRILSRAKKKTYKMVY